MGLLVTNQNPAHCTVAGTKLLKTKVKLTQPHLNFTPSSQVSGEVTLNAGSSASATALALTMGPDRLVMSGLTGENSTNAQSQDTLHQGDQPSIRSWSDVVNESERFVSNIPMVGHKPEIAPEFLNFK